MPNKIYNKRILITGGAGFIGSTLVEELLRHDPARIIIIDNFSRATTENVKSFANNARVDLVQEDIRNNDLLTKLLSRVDYVFHLAALRINACAADPAEGFDVMMKGTFLLAEACKKQKVSKIIYSSSASVYGLAQRFPTPESEPPYDNQTFYGAAKLWGEQLLRSYKFMSGMDYVALRYFNVYGPRMDTHGKYTEVMIRWLDCIREHTTPLIYGDGSDSMDFVHVKDVARANIAALLAEHSDEVFNVGSGVETSLSELLRLLLLVNHSELAPEYRPANSVNPVSRRLADVRKAKSMLGFSARINLENGLKDLSQWYFKQKVNALTAI
jgi:UDP-glucose 4-epimerase